LRDQHERSGPGATRCRPLGGQIVAITPDLQHFTTALKADAAAKPFPILTDIDNGYALTLNFAIFVGLGCRSS
jgi:hypothetical protein